MRLDYYLADKYQLSRSESVRIIKQGQALISGVAVTKASYKVTPNQKIEIDLSLIEKLREEPPPIASLAFEGKLDIIFEDEDLLVLNKPSGMVVHPSCGHTDDTLVNYLLAYSDKLAGQGQSIRPGIVHRLDKETSGLLIVAKTDENLSQLMKQFQDRQVSKKYRALVQGNVTSDHGTISQPLGRNPENRFKVIVTNKPEFNSKEAITHYQVVKRFGTMSLLDIEIETGRTHQIRVHLLFIGYPILGDSLYGKGSKQYPLCLQAYYLGFKHPKTKQFMEFELPSPLWLEELIS